MPHRGRLRSVWNRVDFGGHHRAPSHWQSWLSDTGSLTQKIEHAIGQKLEVIVLSDCRQNLNSDESRYFHFKLRRCRIREVLLCRKGIPLVMGRSIIPTTSSMGSNHAILRLGKHPLGAILFANKHKQKKQKAQREIAHVNKGHPLWKKCSKKYSDLLSPVWARRTLYHLKAHPLLVTEVFLPNLLNYPAKP